MINKDNRNEIFDQTIKYIWRHTHCHSIRLNFFHIKDADGKFKADPETKQMLKSRGFRWKTVKNDMESGMRWEINELANKDEEDQMRRSKAQVFRKDLDREDILKEPLTIYFHSMMTFSNDKCGNKQELVEKDVPSEVASDANILSNLMIYHLEQNKPEGGADLNLPLFSALN